MKKSIILLLFFTLLPLYTAHSQWYRQTIPVSKPITGIEFTDSLKGWAVTSAGSSPYVAYILNTTNGGTNWLIQYTGVDNNFDAFDMVDDSVGYVIGGIITGQPLLLKTTNGGLNWIFIPPGVGMDFDDIFFPNKDTGYICSSDPFAPGLWFTSNGGLSWEVRQSGATPYGLSLFFLNNNTGWVGTMNQILFKTTNAGLNWINNGNFTEQVLGIVFLNDLTGWLGLSGGRIASTINGGINWLINKPFPTVDNNVFDVYMSDAVGWAGIGWFAKILKTTNGGINWGYQDDSCGSVRTSFVDTLKGWSGFLTIGIGHTTNGGGLIIYSGIISNHNNIPGTFILYQNYPNPFNSQTTIRFALNKSGYVKLKIYDVLGREKTIWESSNMLGAGTHELSFNAENFSSGVYFYQLTIINEQLAVVYKETRKMVLIK